MGRHSILFRRILALRMKKKSYGQIASAFGISKSTVAYWLRGNARSQSIHANLAKKARWENGKKLGQFSKERWASYRARAAQEAREQFPALLNDSLFITGLMLYWGEGDNKQGNALRLTNTNPGIINLFVRFLKETMKIPKEKIRVALILYPDLSDIQCKHFWSQTTTLPQGNFMKSQYIQGRHPTKRLSRGICMIVVNSQYQKTKMLTWIDIFSQKYIMSP